MTRNELMNRWRIRRGRPMLHPTDREVSRALDRYDGELRRAQHEVEQLASDAKALDLPMPIPPSRTVGGFIVSAQP